VRCAFLAVFMRLFVDPLNHFCGILRACSTCTHCPIWTLSILDGIDGICGRPGNVETRINTGVSLILLKLIVSLVGREGLEPPTSCL
jgi:hypothetical protein